MKLMTALSLTLFAATLISNTAAHAWSGPIRSGGCTNPSADTTAVLLYQNGGKVKVNSTTKGEQLKGALDPMLVAMVKDVVETDTIEHRDLSDEEKLSIFRGETGYSKQGKVRELEVEGFGTVYMVSFYPYDSEFGKLFAVYADEKGERYLDTKAVIFDGDIVNCEF